MEKDVNHFRMLATIRTKYIRKICFYILLICEKTMNTHTETQRKISETYNSWYEFGRVLFESHSTHFTKNTWHLPADESLACSINSSAQRSIYVFRYWGVGSQHLNFICSTASTLWNTCGLNNNKFVINQFFSRRFIEYILDWVARTQ